MAAGGLLKPHDESVTRVPPSERTTKATKRPALNDPTSGKGGGAGAAASAQKGDLAAFNQKRQGGDQPRKVRVQRETFTMLPNENEKINEVRTRAAANKFFSNRSAVIRAGVMALDRLNDAQLVQVLGRLPVIKPGRS